MAGIRLKISEEPSTPPSSRVEFWFDSTENIFKYKPESGESLALVSTRELEDLRNILTTPVSFKKETYILTPTDVSNGYVVLQFKAETNSVNAFIDRLALHEGSDYLSDITPDNKTKIRFIGSLAVGSQEEISAGLSFSVGYAVK
jgi:hypothetical protein